VAGVGVWQGTGGGVARCVQCVGRSQCGWCVWAQCVVPEVMGKVCGKQYTGKNQAKCDLTQGKEAGRGGGEEIMTK